MTIKSIKTPGIEQDIERAVQTHQDGNTEG